jgi:transposase
MAGVAQPLISLPAKRPQGGGRRRVDDRAVLAVIVYLVQAGCSWWKLPAAMFGVSWATAHRPFTAEGRTAAEVLFGSAARTHVGLGCSASRAPVVLHIGATNRHGMALPHSRRTS